MVHAFMYAWMDCGWLRIRASRLEMYRNKMSQRECFDLKATWFLRKTKQTGHHPASARGEPYLYLESFDLKAA